MTEAEVTSDNWRYVETVRTLGRHPCHRLHARWGKGNDLVIVKVKDSFFAMDAWCSHQGGPLFKGDIEDLKGKCYLMCPWHGYMFQVDSGVEPNIGLQQQTHPVKVVEGVVYVHYKCDLSITPFEESLDKK